MNESASFMEIPEMKGSVRPACNKLWAVVRYGFGGLVLFALGGTTFISLKSVQVLSTEVSQLKTALQGRPDNRAVFRAARFAREAFEYLVLRELALAV